MLIANPCVIAVVQFNKFLICLNLRCWDNNGVYVLLWSKGYRSLSGLKISFTEIAGLLTVWKFLLFLWGGILTHGNSWLTNGKFATFLITQLNTKFGGGCFGFILNKDYFCGLWVKSCDITQINEFCEIALWAQKAQQGPYKHSLRTDFAFYALREKVMWCFPFFLFMSFYKQL